MLQKFFLTLLPRYDKTLQLIVSKDGNIGLNFEHSFVDAIVAFNFTQMVVEVHCVMWYDKAHYAMTWWVLWAKFRTQKGCFKASEGQLEAPEG